MKCNSYFTRRKYESASRNKARFRSGREAVAAAREAAKAWLKAI
jgi:hypothetical protein